MGSGLDNNQTLVPLEDKLYSVIAVEVPRIKEIWNVLGMSVEDMTSREKMIVYHLKEMLKQMYSEESKHKDNILKKIEKNARLYTILCKELGKDPLDPPEILKTLEVERFFRMKLDEAQAEKEERMKSIRDMKNEEEVLCRQLGENPVLFSLEVIPSASAVSELRKRVDEQRLELGQRFEKFKELRTSIMHFMEELDAKPATEFEKEITSKESDFVFSQDRMTKLKEVFELYRSRDEKARLDGQRMRTEIARLVDRLELPDPLADDTREFLRSGAGYRAEDLKALRSRLNDLLAIKRQAVLKLTDIARMELRGLWTDLYFSDEQKDRFNPDVDDPEELLKFYEEEIERLTRLKDEALPVYAKFKSHQLLLHKMQDFEIRSSDTNRYNNRGGALLLEEKERKKLSRDIPKVEEDLNALVDDYDSEHPGEPLLVYGRPVKEFIKNQWENYEDQKDREKQMRAILRTKQIEKEATLGARPLTPKATPNRKRPVGLPTTVSPSKRAKLLGGQSASSSTASSLKRANSSKALPTFMPVDRTVTTDFRQPPQMADFSFVSSDTTYSDFKENLESKGKKDTNTRSSIATRRMSRSTPNLTRQLHAMTSPRRSPRNRLMATPQSASMLLRARPALAGKSPAATRSTPKLTATRRFQLL